MIDINNNDLDQAFKDYFFSRGISIDGLDFQKVPHALYHGAFKYVFDKAIKPNFTSDIRVTIDYEYIYKCYTDKFIIYIYNWFYNTVNYYNLIVFQDWFIDLLGINQETFFRWLDGEASQTRMQIAKSVQQLAKTAVRARLADDRTGVVVLANNDAAVGLEYERKRSTDNAIIQQAVTLQELPRFNQPALGDKKINCVNFSHNSKQFEAIKND